MRASPSPTPSPPRPPTSLTPHRESIPHRAGSHHQLKLSPLHHRWRCHQLQRTFPLAHSATLHSPLRPRTQRQASDRALSSPPKTRSGSNCTCRLGSFYTAIDTGRKASEREIFERTKRTGDIYEQQACLMPGVTGRRKDARCETDRTGRKGSLPLAAAAHQSLPNTNAPHSWTMPL